MRDLVGRAVELRTLRAAAADVRAQGACFFVHGPPGIGKTALLEATVRAARDDGVVPLLCAGAPSEMPIAYAALHQLLQPVLASLDGTGGGAGSTVAVEHRDLVRRAVGMLDAAAQPPEPVAVALATLEILRARAEVAPLLLGVDDVQWLDPSSAQVLSFVARRIAHHPVLLVCTSRERLLPPLADVPFTPIDLYPLDATDTAALVRTTAPDLNPVLRDQLVRVAEGYPSAVVELARAWAHVPGGELLPSPVPVTDRVEAAFAARLVELPTACRALLLLATLQRPGSAERLGEIVAAARTLGHDGAGLDDLAPALDAGLVDVAAGGVTFRHPLVRSVVYHRAVPEDRRRAHAALARVATDVHRATWHRASAATEPDEDVAAALELSADAARRRGAVLESVTALELAADLTPDPARRGSRLVRAAYHASDLGHEDAVARLLDDAEALPLDQVDQARAAWRRYRPQDVVGDYDRMAELVQALGRLQQEGQAETALDSLAPAADIAFWRGVAPRCRDLFCTAVDRLDAGPDPRPLVALALTAPVSRSRFVRASIAELGMGTGAGTASDVESQALVGRAVSVVGDVAGGTAHLERAAGPLRAQGRLGLLTPTLVTYAWNCWHLGRWEAALSAAAEVRDVGRARDRPIVSAVLVEAVVGAAQGQAEAALRTCATVRDVVVSSGSPSLAVVEGYTRGTALLVLGRSEEAYALVRDVFENVDLATLPESVACLGHGVLPLYADVAVRVGAGDEAREAVRRLRAVAQRDGSPLLAASVSYADAVLAADGDDDGAAEPLLQAAVDDLAGWPFLRARARLAYGRWLRRRRRVVESRSSLRTARDGFDTLGAAPWGEAARQELRAAGEPYEAGASDATSQLTAQELEIAHLAAEGLTNREIGNRLYLSPRTVGSHLYHLFPKLGVASRAELAGAIQGAGSTSRP